MSTYRSAIRRTMAEFDQVHGQGAAIADLATGSGLSIAFAIVATLLIVAFTS